MSFFWQGDTIKLSYTNIKSEYFRAIGKPNNSDDASLLAQFNMNLAARYQLALAFLRNYTTQKPYTLTTTASQQYYPYPAGIVNIDGVYITIGSFNYPLDIINSQKSWDTLNAIQIQPSAITQFVFPRRDDFGIWPIPQDEYTITFNYHYRDHSLLVEDESAGSIVATSGSTTITGTGTNFTTGMIGRWLEITDTTYSQYGYWYRIAGSSGTTNLTLETAYQGSTISGATYRVCQVPEFPDEGHISLLHGVLADYYANSRDDADRAAQYENRFWTGDTSNNLRQKGSDNIVGGIIGLANRYSDRNDERLVQRKPKLYPLPYKAFAYDLS